MSYKLSFLFLVFVIVGCSTYKQNIMFKTGEGFASEPMVKAAESNYVIKAYDILSMEVYSNHGEKLIDPNPELSTSPQAQNVQAKPIEYRVDSKGVVKFPLVSEVMVEGLTLLQAEMMLQKQYEQFFKTPFVKLKFNNKRVIILGSPGGQVLPLVNENVSLSEVLAMAKGIDNLGKAHNIKVLRGEKVFLVDFSTVEGYRSGNMKIEPGDIVYVEPIRRPFAEGLREYSLIISFVATLTTIITLLTR